MKTFLFAACLLQVVLSSPRTNKAITCGYDACPKTDPTKLNVHYVPHTHDDVGWVKTVDQYYYGLRSNIRKAGVQFILDSVVHELLEDPAKRFIFVETAFFWKWWLEQTPLMQQSVKDLVNEGRLEFIGGAWSMNDEATTIYQSTIDQFAWGLRKLNETFGVCGRPTIGWQIDPFGHAREQASLMTQYGFDGLFFGRIDYQDKVQRLANQTMEMVWETSDTLGPSADIFTGVLYNHYIAPVGYCFDDSCNDEPIIDNPESPNYNVDYRTFGFYIIIKNQQMNYRSNNIMLTMGGDFQYHNAQMYFKNSDKLIKYMNELYPDVNIFYSTPSCYLKSLNEADLSWPTKNDDFFPYASGSNSYWTGYFTSRPTLKRFERSAHNTLQVGKQLATLSDIGDEAEERLTIHREAQGVLQHHDAVAGTEKQAVAEDYARILQIGVAATEEVVSDALQILMQKSTSALKLNFDSCSLYNISQCTLTEESKTFLITVYNPLSRIVSNYVRVPVAQGTYTILDPQGVVVPSQIVPVPESVKKVPGRTSTASQDILFNARNIPPMGYRTFYVSQTGTAEANYFLKRRDEDKSTVIANKHLSLVFDAKTNLLKNIVSQREFSLSQNLEYYIGAEGSNAQESLRSSGAYIFRPTTEQSVPISANASSTVYDGPIVSEVHQVFSDWASQVVRLYADSNVTEFEWLVGPIPTEDKKGREIINKFRTNLNTEGRITTDSNGRSDITHVRDFRPTWSLDNHEPVAGNYYPITLYTYIDNGTDRLALVTDRAQGGGSINDGELEVMVHRRLLHDDAFGVDEALDEKAFGTGLVSRGRHYVLTGSTTSSASTQSITLLAQQKLMDTLIFTSNVTGQTFASIQNNFNLEFSGLTSPLPNAVQILTLEPWSNQQILLRLENIFTEEESPVPVVVNVTNMFSNFVVISGRETNLAANKLIEETTRLQWKKSDNEQLTPPKIQREALDLSSISLGPKEIRTFIINVQRTK